MDTKRVVDNWGVRGHCSLVTAVSIVSLKFQPFPGTLTSMAAGSLPQPTCLFHIRFFVDSFQYLQVHLEIKPRCLTILPSQVMAKQDSPVINLMAMVFLFLRFFSFNFIHPCFCSFPNFLRLDAHLALLWLRVKEGAYGNPSSSSFQTPLQVGEPRTC